MPKETAVPVNYRLHLLNISGQEILVGAMAAPDRRNANPNAAMAYIAEKAGSKKALMIGLKEASFQNLANKHGVEYIHLPIIDFTKASPETYEQLFKYISKACLDN